MRPAALAADARCIWTSGRWSNEFGFGNRFLDQSMRLHGITSVEVSEGDDRRAVPVENAEADAVEVAAPVDRLDFPYTIHRGFSLR